MLFRSGDYTRETVFSEDPAAMARHWQDLGASRVHLVDLDGAASGSLVNRAVIQEVLRVVTVPVQVGGGIRDLKTVDAVLGWGADRVVLGTAAVKDPAMVEAACKKDARAVVVALDARNGRVAVQGWREHTDQDALELARRMADLGVPRFLYTDIARDGTATEPNFRAIAQLLEAAGRPVIASGGVARLEHLQRLRALGAEAAIVGQALYTGAIELPAAIAAVAA